MQQCLQQAEKQRARLPAYRLVRAKAEGACITDKRDRWGGLPTSLLPAGMLCALRGPQHCGQPRPRLSGGFWPPPRHTAQHRVSRAGLCASWQARAASRHPAPPSRHAAVHRGAGARLCACAPGGRAVEG
ncbi:hypothetical protein ABPG75_006696 [Micractinium tetrahymenae]